MRRRGAQIVGGDRERKARDAWAAQRGEAMSVSTTPPRDRMGVIAHTLL